MKVKKVVFILLAVIVLGGVIGFFGYKYFINKNFTPTAVVTPTPTPKLPKPEDFQWGINTTPNGLGDYNPEKWQIQLDIAKKLGVEWVRFAWEWQDGDNVFNRENAVLAALWQNGFNVMMVLEPRPGWENADTYKEGYELAKSVSSYYKGKIPLYQIVNEGDAMTVKSQTSSGEKTTDYDPVKYTKIKNFLEGASKGLKEGDPAAKTIITTVCTQTGYLDLVASDANIKFDYIGMDWYNWCDPIGSKKGDDGKTLTVTKLKSYGKPMIITENNAWPSMDPATRRSDIVDENLQASTITDTAEWAYANKDWVKGYYVFSLFDDKFSDSPLYFGIYGSERQGVSISSVPTVAKKAYTTYQAIIKKYSK